ncbi:uncharacterized protein LOC141544481 isoform X1 [Sminthopsis crassicaudata]|uniref:uncharacterized protein LOC141544481 isoform X1 n=1 Tax=Sminthopsis crassicaudata TaxID=9301 RepID=UPI003D69BD44
MKKIFNFCKKEQSPSHPSIKLPSYFAVGTPDLTPGYLIQDKDLGKLHKAASIGDVAKMQQLLLLGKHNVNDLDKVKRTPLHLACAKGYPDIVSLLVERKCKVDLQDKDSLTPLIKAILCHQEECAIILLKHGADPNLGDRNNNTALHYAAFDQNIAMVEKLLTYKADIEAKNKEGFTPFMFAVMKRSYELVELLLKMGANVNATDNTKKTSLMIAISMESMGIVNLLFQNNVDPTCEDEDGWTAEKYAKHFRYPLSWMFLVEIHSSAVGSASGITRAYLGLQTLTKPWPFEMPSKPFHITMERGLLSLLTSLLAILSACAKSTLLG